jgi:signal transduction histidine kinase
LATQKEDTNKVTTLISLSGAYRFSYPDSGLVYAQRALSLAEKLNSDVGTFWSIGAINGSLYVLGNYALELDYAFKALPLAKKINTPYTIGFSNGWLSDSYYNLGEYSTSLKYWREVVKIAEQVLPDERPAIYGVSSHIFEGMHQYDSGLIYAKKSYELIKLNPSLYKENDGGKFIRSGIFAALGDAFTGKAYYDSALFYYRMSLPFSDQIHMDINKVDAYNGIAKVYKETNNFDSATWYAKRALHEKVIRRYPLGFLKAANLLAAIYESEKNSDSSLKYLHIAINLKDSFYNRERTIAFQSIIFREQEKQKEIEAAKLKLQSEYRMYFLIALLVTLLTVTAIIIRNKRRKQLQNMRNSIADDLHDDIGSTLSSISIMSELAKAKSPEGLPLLASIGESAITIQENMSDIVWAVKSENDRFESVLQRMNQFASEILDAKNIDLDFKSDPSLSASRLTMEQRKNFYLFFKEIINNAAKYSDAKKVSVYISQKGHYAEVNINDNGKGFDSTKIFSGNGMNTLKKRAAELNADFKIASHINEGTAVQLKFKIT